MVNVPFATIARSHSNARPAFVWTAPCNSAAIRIRDHRGELTWMPFQRLEFICQAGVWDIGFAIWPAKRLLFRLFSAALCTSYPSRSEEQTSELQSPCNLVCRLLL